MCTRIHLYIAIFQYQHKFTLSLRLLISWNLGVPLMKTRLTTRKIIFIILDSLIFAIIIALWQMQGFYIFYSIHLIICILYLYNACKKSGIIDYLNFQFGYYAPIIIVPILALIFFFLLTNYYRPDEIISKSDSINFYGSFLSFIGTFCLGYFIYRKGESNRIDEKISKCKQLLNCLETTDMEMMRVARYGYTPAFIDYDANWINYFYEYESLIHSTNSELKSTLNKHFKTINDMNIAITKGDYKTASKIYEASIIDDCYSVSKYNQLEAKLCISDACAFKQYGFNTFKTCWLEKPEIKKTIDEYSNAYYPIIETYVWNYMLKNNLKNTSNHQLEREITDWLLQNDVFKQIAKFPSDKRIIVKIVFTCFIMINKQSSRLSYVWSEFSLKN